MWVHAGITSVGAERERESERESERERERERERDERRCRERDRAGEREHATPLHQTPSEKSWITDVFEFFDVVR